MGCGASKAHTNRAANAARGTEEALVAGQVAVAYFSVVNSRSLPKTCVQPLSGECCVSWQFGNNTFDRWTDFDPETISKLEELFGVFCACEEGRVVKVVNAETAMSVDFELMSETITAGQDMVITEPRTFPVRRLRREGRAQLWSAVSPDPARPHPLRLRRILEKDGADWLNNEFFWRAFQVVLRKSGHRVDPTSADRTFDFANNQDYRHGWRGPRVLIRGGAEYEVPLGWKRYAVRVAGNYDDGDNAWMSLDGREGEWAVAYHGTHHEALAPIVLDGLKAGSRQMFQKEVGKGVYVTPLLRTAQAYAEEVCLDGHRVQFVVQCRVRPSAIKICSRADYWVINDSKDLRPYGILVRDRGVPKPEQNHSSASRLGSFIRLAIKAL